VDSLNVEFRSRAPQAQVWVLVVIEWTTAL